MSGVTTRLLCLLAALLCGTAGVLLSPRPAYACSCTLTSTYRSLSDADAVFRGTVTEQDRSRTNERSRVDIRFQVSDVYKGTVYADQVVSSAAMEASCGLEPELGSEWIIFATETIEGTGDRAVARLATTSCSGDLVDGRTPAVLGQPRPPTPGASDREERSVDTDRRLNRGVLVLGAGLLGAGAVLALALALVWRTRSAGPEG